MKSNSNINNRGHYMIINTAIHEKKLYGLYIFPWLQTNQGKNEIGSVVNGRVCLHKMKTRFLN